jgi:hypothetical protein
MERMVLSDRCEPFDGNQTNHALTFKLDHSNVADHYCRPKRRGGNFETRSTFACTTIVNSGGALTVSGKK